MRFIVDLSVGSSSSGSRSGSDVLDSAGGYEDNYLILYKIPLIINKIAEDRKKNHIMFS